MSYSRSRYRIAFFACESIAIILLVVSQNESLASTSLLRENGFPKPIASLFETKCVKCHSPERQEAGLDLTSLSALLEGSESGPVLDTAAPLESLLWERIESGEMPPSDHEPLSEMERAQLREWISSVDWVTDEQEELHQHRVLPILRLRCGTCHGRQLTRGNLDVRSVESLLIGGESGPAIRPGSAQDSLLLQRVHREEMPPRKDLARYSVKPMEPNEIRLIEDWLNAGAPTIPARPTDRENRDDPLVSATDREFWSFQPIRSIVPPELSSSSAAPANAIDLFVDRQQTQRGLTATSLASPQILARRVYFDLHGISPNPDEIEEFVKDYEQRGPVAMSRLVDRLLASPRYGERWGGHWLDLAGYSDSEGVQHSDPIRPHAWRYRDYVIRSFSADKPYDRFLQEQIAGDELSDYLNADRITEELYDNLVATAFLKLAPDGTFAGITGFVPDRLEAIDDSLEVLSSSVMGLTIRCARCHSHKFDPLPQRDYYRLAAIFKGALDENDWLQPIEQTRLEGVGVRTLPYVTTDELETWEHSEAELGKQIDAINADGNLTEEDRRSAVDELERQRQPRPAIRALWDQGEPSPTYLLRRGDYRQPGRLVQPGVPAVLTTSNPVLQPKPPWPGSGKTGLRLEFARWLTQDEHPLTARVIVNRLWHQHFGQGLVTTLDDFGRAGALPSHPLLLDWLALELTRNDWSIKALHRQMLLSNAWRRDSRMSKEQEAADPTNRWLTRMPLRRLDAEALRDTMLELSGRLSSHQFGPSDPVTARDDGLVTVPEINGQWRRSIYVIKRRTEPVSLLSVFDRPEMTPNCVRRMESTVAPQALHLMNNQVVYELSKAFAQRVSQTTNSVDEQLRLAHQLALGRAPTPAEHRLLREHLDLMIVAWQDDNEEHGDKLSAEQRALASVCHALLNSAAFMYVD